MAAVVVLAVAVVGGPASASASRASAAAFYGMKAPGHLLGAPAHGRTAVEALGDHLDEAASRNHMSPKALQRLLLHDHTAWLDRDARMYYVEKDRAMVGSGGQTAPPAPHPYTDTFKLHSSPGSQRTIFLDFDGGAVTGTLWNDKSGVSTDPQPPFDMDGDPGSFSTGEQDMIQEIWRQVAEDYAPFDVDVTTEDPGSAALERTSLSDQQFGMRVLFTPSVQAATAICDNSCGGVAYVDVFDEAGSSYHQPAWVFTHLQGNTPEFLATTAAHEVGHTFGLQHDGTSTSDYYDGDAQWAPIMGGPSWGVSQWSKGDYPDADNHEDDMAIISAGGAPLRTDDFGDTVDTADPLGADPAQPVHGLIGTRADRDVFSFDVTCAGKVHVTVSPEARGADVDLSLRILDQFGSRVLSADPPVAGDFVSGMSGLDGDVTVTLEPGTYYAVVDGAGTGYPTSAGYTDYGSLGRYTLGVSSCGGATAATSSTPATPVQDLTAVRGAASGTVLVAWAPPADDGGSPVTSYRLDWFDSAKGAHVGSADVSSGTLSHTVAGLADGRGYYVTVRAVTAAALGQVSRSSDVIPATTPGRTRITGSWSGAPGGRVTAKVGWAAPASGGSPITRYRVVALRLDSAGRVVGRTTLTAPASARSATARLPRRARYRFTVQAANLLGAGPVSALSKAVLGR